MKAGDLCKLSMHGYMQLYMQHDYGHTMDCVGLVVKVTGSDFQTIKVKWLNHPPEKEFSETFYHRRYLEPLDNRSKTDRNKLDKPEQP